VSSPPFLAGGVVGEELGFVRGRFVPKLKIGKAGGKRGRRSRAAAAAAVGIPVKGRRVQGNKQVGEVEWGLGEVLVVRVGAVSEREGQLTAATAMERATCTREGGHDGFYRHDSDMERPNTLPQRHECKGTRPARWSRR
jgi:hypothetical protein